MARQRWSPAPPIAAATDADLNDVAYDLLRR